MKLYFLIVDEDNIMVFTKKAIVKNGQKLLSGD